MGPVYVRCLDTVAVRILLYFGCKLFEDCLLDMLVTVLNTD